jgi:hypothetical protein
MTTEDVDAFVTQVKKSLGMFNEYMRDKVTSVDLV